MGIWLSICRTDKAFLFWSGGTVTFDTQKHCLKLLLITLHKFAGSIKVKKVQVGKDQEKAQSEKDSHSKNRGGKKPN